MVATDFRTKSQRPAEALLLPAGSDGAGEARPSPLAARLLQDTDTADSSENESGACLGDEAQENRVDQLEARGAENDSGRQFPQAEGSGKALEGRVAVPLDRGDDGNLRGRGLVAGEKSSGSPSEKQLQREGSVDGGVWRQTESSFALSGSGRLKDREELADLVSRSDSSVVYAGCGCSNPIQEEEPGNTLFWASRSRINSTGVTTAAQFQESLPPASPFPSSSMPDLTVRESWPCPSDSAVGSPCTSCDPADIREQQRHTSPGLTGPCLSSTDVQGAQLDPSLASASILSSALLETGWQQRRLDRAPGDEATGVIRRATRRAVLEEGKERTDHCEAPQRSACAAPLIVERSPTEAAPPELKRLSPRGTGPSTRTMRESDPLVAGCVNTAAACDAEQASLATNTSFLEHAPRNALPDLQSCHPSPAGKLVRELIALETPHCSRTHLCADSDRLGVADKVKEHLLPVRPASECRNEEACCARSQSGTVAVSESGTEPPHALCGTSTANQDRQERRENLCSPRTGTARKEESENPRGVEGREGKGSDGLFTVEETAKARDDGHVDEKERRLVPDEYPPDCSTPQAAQESLKTEARGGAGAAEPSTPGEESSHLTAEQLRGRNDGEVGQQGGAEGEGINTVATHSELEELVGASQLTEPCGVALGGAQGGLSVGPTDPHLQERPARLVTSERAGGGKGRAVWSIRKSAGADDVDVWLEGFRKNPPEILSEADLWRVCQRIKQLLVEENNVQPVPAPCIVCGDIHGQFFDLLKLFEVGGLVGEQHYVFLGDYVDRGYNSVETFQYLMLLKLKYPRHITLLRGNHESRQITTVYGFYDECVRKYGNANPWKFCTEVFDYLALAAVIDEEVFCVHGGLSPDLKLLDQLRLIYRVQEIPHEGTFGDIVWSDPDDVDEWAENPRGAGWLFGDKVVRRFNHLNGLQLIARAHQLAMEGFRYMFSDSSVVTVWSAPNYCYRCGNVAAVMKLDSDLGRRMLIFKQTDDHHVTTRARAATPYFL